MKIQLKGNLHTELINIGLQSGDIVEATKCSVSKVGVMHFDHRRGTRDYSCSVWPINYDIIATKETQDNPNFDEGVK